MKRFVVISLLMLAAGIAAVLLLRGPPAGGTVAAVHGHPITEGQLDAAIRAHLWRANQTWEKLDHVARQKARTEVLQTLRDDALIRHQRQADGAVDVAAAAAEELRLWRRQFETEIAAAERLKSQRLTEAELEKRILEAQLDGAWLEAQLRRRSGAATDAEVRAWHQAHAESLRVPETHHVAHLFLTAHDPKKPERAAEMAAIQDKLKAQPGAWSELIRKHSEDPRTKDRAGDLGWISRTRMPPDFMDAVERLQPGQTSGPLRTTLGWHLIRVLERRPSTLPSWQECRSEIEAHLSDGKRATALELVLKELRDRERP